MEQTGCIEQDKCDFCHEIKGVERTYLRPSKYVKPNTLEERNKFYNQGDYFIIIKTCSKCGVPKENLQKPVESDAVEFAEFIRVNRYVLYYIYLGEKYVDKQGQEITTKELYEHFQQLNK